MTPASWVRVWLSVPFDLVAIAFSAVAGFILGGPWLAKQYAAIYVESHKCLVAAMQEANAEREAEIAQLAARKAGQS